MIYPAPHSGDECQAKVNSLGKLLEDGVFGEDVVAKHKGPNDSGRGPDNGRLGIEGSA